MTFPTEGFSLSEKEKREIRGLIDQEKYLELTQKTGNSKEKKQ